MECGGEIPHLIKEELLMLLCNSERIIYAGYCVCVTQSVDIIGVSSFLFCLIEISRERIHSLVGRFQLGLKLRDIDRSLLGRGLAHLLEFIVQHFYICRIASNYLI